MPATYDTIANAQKIITHDGQTVLGTVTDLHYVGDDESPEGYWGENRVRKVDSDTWRIVYRRSLSRAGVALNQAIRTHNGRMASGTVTELNVL